LRWAAAAAGKWSTSTDANRVAAATPDRASPFFPKEIVMRVGVGIVGVALLLGAGCSSSKSISSEQAELELGTGLADVGDMLRAYTEETGRAPTRPADVMRNEALYPRGIQAIRSGEVKVIWGVKMPPAGTGGTEIIAYEKSVESEGGGVLLLNGEVKRMTADEFKAAPKATK
jgi:hypothetical protein